MIRLGGVAALVSVLATVAFAQTDTITVEPLAPVETPTEPVTTEIITRIEGVASAAQGTVRVLDKITGAVTDLTLTPGETQTVGHLHVTLGDCRYPIDNPAGDAFIEMTIRYQEDDAPVFSGWMIASAPALNAMDHPRYDVWALACITQ